MELGIVFTFLHISTMITAVTLALGPSFAFERVASSGDVLATRIFVGRMAGFERHIPLFFMAGAIFGLLAAATIGFDLLAPWLVLAYVLFAGIMVLQLTVGSRWRTALSGTLSAVPVGVTTSPALAEVASARVGQLVYWATVAGTVVIVFDMVAKPFS